MAKPKLYPHRHYVRLSDEANDQAHREAKATGLPLAVVLRTKCERPLDVKRVKKGEKDVRAQKEAKK